MNAAAKHQPDLLERPASLLVPTWVRQADPAQLHALITAQSASVHTGEMSYKCRVYITRVTCLTNFVVRDHRGAVLGNWLICMNYTEKIILIIYSTVPCLKALLQNY